MNISNNQKLIHLFFNPNLNVVRWHRKPRWVPQAKSKIFRVPERTKISDEEKLKLRVEYNHYSTRMRSINEFIKNDFKTVLKFQNQQKKDDEKLEEQNELLNEIWNKEVALNREIRLEKESKIRKEKILESLMEAERKEKEDLLNYEEIIKKEMESSVNYITKENIDMKIEEALANPVDKTYAIDLQGNVYKGFRENLKIIENKN